MHAPIDDQVVDFYYALFGKIFSEPFRARLSAERRKRDTVVRQVEESASAASGSLSRFFVNRQLNEKQVADILAGYTPLSTLLSLDDISNTNIAPQSLADELLDKLPPAASSAMCAGSSSAPKERKAQSRKRTPASRRWSKSRRACAA